MAKLFLSRYRKRASPRTLNVGACVMMVELCRGKAFARLRSTQMLTALRAVRNVRNYIARQPHKRVTNEDYERKVRDLERLSLLLPEALLRAAFALWMDARGRRRIDAAAAERVRRPRAGGAWWLVWQGLRRGAMAEAMAQLADVVE